MANAVARLGQGVKNGVGYHHLANQGSHLRYRDRVNAGNFG